MFNKHAKRYTPRFKFQVIMEVIKSSKPIGQIARAWVCWGVSVGVRYGRSVPVKSFKNLTVVPIILSFKI